MKITLLILFSLSVTVLFAQDSGEINELEVVIEKEAALVLPESNRRFERIKEEEVTFDSLTLDYSDITVLPASIRPFNLGYTPRQFESTGKTTSRRNFLKAGFGNYASAELGGHYTIDAKKLGQYHASAHYLRFGKGPVSQQESGFSSLNVDLGAYNTFQHISLTSDVSVENRFFQFYGTPDGIIDPLDNPSANMSSFYVGTLLGANDLDKLRLELEPSIRITTFGSDSERFNEESIFDLTGRISKKSKKNEWNYGVDVALQNIKYTSGITTENTRTQFGIQPFIGLRGDNVTIKTSMLALLAKDSTNGNNQSYFYPSLELTWNFDNQLTIYADFSSGLQPLTLNELRYSNHFLNDSLDLRNRSTLADIQLQVSKKLGKSIYTKVGGSIELIDNQYFIVNSSLDPRRFDIEYDPSTFSKIDIAFLLQYQIHKKLSVISDLHFYEYNTSKSSFPYHLPTMSYNLSSVYDVSKKLKMNGEVLILSGIKTRNDENEIVSLNSIFDVSIGATYAVLQNLELYAQMDNILNRPNQRYLNYPSIGLNAKFGFIFRF